MDICVAGNKQGVGRLAAAAAAQALRETLDTRGDANLVLATGASQFEMFHELVSAEVDWQRVTCFHLDEYLGLPQSHPASFRRYLGERFCRHITGPRAFVWINGDGADPEAECVRLGAIIRRHPIDVACIGIGENAHLAFNDPPANFETEVPYLIVDLDEACRRQQLNEGWFPSLDKVPHRAISMSIQQIMKSAAIVCTVPDERKARAVQAAVEGTIATEVPASILQQHARVTLVLDSESASLLSRTSRSSANYEA